MDTPEPDATDPAIRAGGHDAATAANSGLVEGKDVYLEREVSDTDRFGRPAPRRGGSSMSAGSYVLGNLDLVRLGYAQSRQSRRTVRYVRELTTRAEEGAGRWRRDLGPSAKSIVAGGALAAGASAAVAPDAGGESAGCRFGRQLGQCHPSYDPCLPIVQDLDCAQVRAMGKAPVTVKGPDDYMLDPEDDKLGCESNE
jgi:hypothetical protein